MQQKVELYLFFLSLSVCVCRLDCACVCCCGDCARFFLLFVRRTIENKNPKQIECSCFFSFWNRHTLVEKKMAEQGPKVGDARSLWNFTPSPGTRLFLVFL